MIMKIIMSCLSEDTKFINAVKKDFEKSSLIEFYTMAGITGYDAVMLILTAANTIGALIVPFIIMHMTNNKNDDVKSCRSVSIELDDKHIVKLECEGCSEETVYKMV